MGLTTASNFAIGGRSSSSTLGNGTYNLTGGTLHVLSGAVPYIGRYGTGKLKIGPGATATFDFTSSGVVGGNTGNGLIDMTGGNLTTSGELRVGTTDTNGPGYNAVGTINISGGTATISAITLARGNNNQSTTTGNLNVSNGATLNNVNDLFLGYAGNNDLGKMTIAGSGTVVNVGTTAVKWLALGYYDTSKGELDISGGALNLENNTSIVYTPGNTSSSGTNVINQTGGTVTFYSDSGFTVGGTGNLNLAQSGSATSNNTYNLNGGTLTVPKIVSNTNNGARTFNFNGGTLKAAAADTTSPSFVAFMDLGSGGTGTAVANVRNGGAIIDSNTYDITIATPLIHSIIGGDNAIDGGLNKQGLGKLVLPGANTYTGATSVNGGALSVTGSITASSVTVNSGALDGTGSITQGVTIANSAANILTNGNGGGGTLSLLSSLGFQGAAGFNPRLVQTTPVVPGVAVTGVLSTTPASGLITVTPVTTSGSWNNGIYTLLTFGSDPGVLLTDFTLVPVTGLSPRQSAAAAPSLILTASSLQLQINGTAITWTGLDSTNWAVGLNGVNKNWQYTGIKTDYLDGDIVIFDDTGINRAIDLGTSVVPGNMTFNNSAVDYSISSVGFYGILSSSGTVVSSLTKSGTRSLTLNIYNDYRGGTFFNGGTLNIGNSTALGTGSFNVGTGNPKTLDNTNVTSTTLFGITSQAWNDDFTFAGTNSLDMGGAPVTLGGGGAAPPSP